MACVCNCSGLKSFKLKMNFANIRIKLSTCTLQEPVSYLQMLQQLSAAIEAHHSEYLRDKSNLLSLAAVKEQGK